MPTFSKYFFRLFVRWFSCIALLLLVYYIYVFLTMKEVFSIAPVILADFWAVTVFCVFGLIVAVIPAGLFSVIHAVIRFPRLQQNKT